jgi:hypothetical protein
MTTSSKATKINVEDLVAKIAEAQYNANRWSEIAKELKATLTGLHDQGVVATKFTAAGCKVALQAGRRSLVLTEAGKAAVSDLQTRLVVAGEGEYRVGEAFWVLKADSAPVGAPRG